MKSKRTLSAVLGGMMSVCFAFSGLSAVPQNVVLAEDAENTAAEVNGYKNPVYDAETDTTEWDYVYFGEYPQSEVKGDELTDAIKNAQYNLANVAEVDGVKYKKLNANGATYTYQYTSDKSIPASEGEFFTWEDREKDYHYFKYEPIRWRVLQSKEDGTLLLMADEALDDVKNISLANHKVNWNNSDTRSWLNEYNGSSNSANVDYEGIGFLSAAFSKEEQDAIQTTTVYTEDNLFWDAKVSGMPDGSPSYDKLFVLSASEAANSAYGFAPDDMTPSKTRQIKMTDYAFARGGWAGNVGELQGNCWWILRSPGDHERKTALGYRDGRVYKEGYYSNMTPYYCVVPVCVVSADSEYVVKTTKKAEAPTQSAAPAATGEAVSGESVTKEAVSQEAVEPGSSQKPIEYGNADGKGEVDLDDAQTVLKMALKILAADDATKVIADVDGNGEVDLDDALLILKKALKIISEFPVETATPSPAPSQSVSPAPSEEASEEPSAEPSLEPLVQPVDNASGDIWIAGDSIAALHENSDANMRATIGWGVILERYLSGAAVHNTALSSRSSKSYLQEPQYKEIMNGIKAGDYLLISFGHNDEFPELKRHTNPYGASDEEGSYKWYLKNYYIDPAIRKGAIPVLISSVVERNFVDGKFNYQFHSVYRTAMQELVAEYKEQGITIAYIDLHDKMQALYEELGDYKTQLLHAVYRSKDSDDNEIDVIDNTHFTLAGARYATKYIIEGLKTNNMNLIEKFANDEMIATLDSIATPEMFNINDLDKWITQPEGVNKLPADGE